MRFVIVVALVCVAAVAFGGFKMDSPGPGSSREWVPIDDPTMEVKWVQTPDGANSLASQDDVVYPFFAQVADDFQCDQTGPILAIEWWGTYTSDGPPPTVPYFFMIEFWTDNPGPPSHPEVMLYQEPCENFTEEYDADYGQYHYVQYLDTPFFQEIGNIYWISIYAVFPFPPQYYWCTGEPQWNDCASFRSDFFGFPDWTTSVDVWGACYDTAFVLYGPSASPVEESSWGTIKMLFR